MAIVVNAEGSCRTRRTRDEGQLVEVVAKELAQRGVAGGSAVVTRPVLCVLSGLVIREPGQVDSSAETDDLSAQPGQKDRASQ